MPKIRESKNRVRTYRTKVECGECKININQDNIPHHVKSKHPGKSEKDIEFQRITSNNQLTLSGFGFTSKLAGASNDLEREVKAT